MWAKKTALAKVLGIDLSGLNDEKIYYQPAKIHRNVTLAFDRGIIVAGLKAVSHTHPNNENIAVEKADIGIHDTVGYKAMNRKVLVSE